MWPKWKVSEKQTTAEKSDEADGGDQLLVYTVGKDSRNEDIHLQRALVLLQVVDVQAAIVRTGGETTQSMKRIS